MTEPQITHAVSLSEHNFLVKTLNRNPLGVDVMEVAAFISRLQTSAQEQLTPKAAPGAPPVEKTPVAAAVGGAGDPA